MASQKQIMHLMHVAKPNRNVCPDMELYLATEIDLGRMLLMVLTDSRLGQISLLCFFFWGGSDPCDEIIHRNKIIISDDNLGMDCYQVKLCDHRTALFIGIPECFTMPRWVQLFRAIRLRQGQEGQYQGKDSSPPFYFTTDIL